MRCKSRTLKVIIMNLSTQNNKPTLNLSILKAIYRNLDSEAIEARETLISKGRLGKVLKAMLDNKDKWLMKHEIVKLARVDNKAIKFILAELVGGHELIQEHSGKVRGVPVPTYKFIVDEDNIALAKIIIKKERLEGLTKADLLAIQVKKIAREKGYVLRSALAKDLKCGNGLLTRALDLLMGKGVIKRSEENIIGKRGIYVLVKH